MAEKAGTPMKDAPISPNLKVRSQTITPVTTAERAAMYLAQMGEGFQAMPAIARGVIGRITGAPAPEMPRPFRKGTPPPSLLTQPQRRELATAYAAEQARLAAKGRLDL